MRSALLYKYGDIAYWTGNYAEGGNDLIEAATLNAEAQSPTYHIRPAELTAERRADVDKSLEGYVRLNGRYRYQSSEQAYNGDKPAVRREHWRKKTLMQKVKEWFVEVVEE
jgi:hypothetical protein